MVFNEMPVPEFEHQQRPNLLGPVRPSLLVIIDDPGNCAGIQIPAARRISSQQIVSCELPQRSVEPRCDGDGKALLRAVDDLIRDDSPHRAFEHVFGDAITQIHFRRNGRGENSDRCFLIHKPSQAR